MNNTRTNNLGIDIPINNIQLNMYPLLQSRWSNKIDGYGRVYKTEGSTNGKKIEAFKENMDYSETFYDDRYDCVFFFLDNDDHDTDDELVFKSDVKVVFMVNLDNIINHEGRNDEQAHRDAIEILRELSDIGYTIKGLEKGIDNVFRGVDSSAIKFDDLHPHHMFAVKIELPYYLTDKCT